MRSNYGAIMEILELNEFCFYHDTKHYPADCLCYDFFDMPEELLACEAWSEAYWVGLQHHKTLDLAEHNRIGLELVKEIKPYVAGYGKFFFKMVVSIESLPESRRKFTGGSIEV